MGSYRDVRSSAGDSRSRVAALAILLALLAVAAGVAPAAGALAGSTGITPYNLIAPSLGGDPRVGATLTCAPGTWNGDYAIDHVWLRDGEPIAGAHGLTYTVAPQDAGSALACDETASGDGAASDAAGTEIYVNGPIALTRPVLTGDDRLGGVLGCTRGVWDDRDLAPYAVAYSWSRDGEPIAGATASTHTVVAADLDTALVCTVTADESNGADSQTASPHGPVNRVAPRITGDLRVGGTLACSRGDWDDEDRAPYAVSYAWTRDGDPIALATGATRRVDLLDPGHEIACEVTAAGLTAADSSPVTPSTPASRSAPQISGDLRLGQTLSCSRGTWDDADLGDYPVTYAWSRDGAAAGTGATHVVAAGDLGHALTCTVAADGFPGATSVAVHPTAPEARTAPALTGDARLGRTLTCSRGGWDDADIAPYAVSYQWLRDGTAVATGPSLVVGAADADHGLSCRVTAAGLTTADSRVTYVGQPRALTDPDLSGDPRPGQALHCGRGTWDEPAGAPYAVGYRWFNAGVATAGTSDTYTVAATDTALYCEVTAAGLTTARSATLTVSDPAVSPTPVNRAAPAITGVPSLRRTLTCGRGTWNDPVGAPYTVTYRWLRDGVAIAGETAAAHTVVAPDIAAALRCEAAVGAVSASSQTVHPAAPVSTGAPEVSGDPRLRRTLHCTDGDWDQPDYALSRRWLRDGAAIAGATAADYVLAAADLGHGVRCDVQADGLTVASSATIAARAPRNLLGPPIAGDPRLRRTLTCGRGDWDDQAADRYAVSYRWLRDGVAIAGATANTYAVVALDFDTALTCEATAEGATTAVSDALRPVAPRNLVVPALSGTPRLRQLLSCGRGDWDDQAADRYAVSYRWLRAGAPIAGQTGTTYRVTAADLEQPIACEVTAEGLTQALSEDVTPAAPVNIHTPELTGDSRPGQALTCSRGDWDDTAADRYAVTYRWLRDDAPVASGSAYTVATADEGHELACDVTAEGSTVALSPSVEPGPPQNVIAPALTGAPHLRGTLACSRGSWDDTAADRYAVSYQWLRDDAPVPGATTPGYAVGAADFGTTLVCRVTAAGATTADSEGVRVEPPHVVDGPGIDGQAFPRHTLACTAGWNDSPAAPYRIGYQWKRDGKVVAGADDADYLVTPADVGHELQCIVTAEGAYTATASIYASWQPLMTTMASRDDVVVPGAQDAYTVTVRNPNPADASVDRTEVTLPEGFSYRPGSTTGALTDDPQTSGTTEITLTWADNVPVAADGTISFTVGLVAPSTAGDYLGVVTTRTPNYDFGYAYSYGALISVEAPLNLATCTITGTDGPDVLVGTPGDDVICGLGGDDVLSGGGGNDKLYGGAGDDRLYGGDGNDVLNGGLGSDVLYADAGADVMRGGGGIDTVNYTSRTDPVYVTVGADARDGSADDGYPGPDVDGDGIPDGPSEGDDVAVDVEIVRGGHGDDQLTAGPADSELDGGDGADVLYGGDGSDLLDGGNGDDWLVTRGDGNTDRALCGPGYDRYSNDEYDRLASCEVYFSIPEHH